MGGDEHHTEPRRGEHHRHVAVARQMRQELGEAGVAEPGEIQGVLVHRPRDDRVRFPGQRQADSLCDCLAGNPAGDIGRRRVPLPTPE